MLIEALVAILIFTLGILAVLGMQSASILQVSQAKYRTDASYLANQIIGKMWADPANLSAYTSSSGRGNWDTVVSKTLPNGTGAVTFVQSAPVAGAPPPAPVGGLVTVTIQWRAPDETRNHQYSESATIHPTSDPS